MDAFEEAEGPVIARMVQQWVADHPDQVEQAGASIAAWREARRTKRG
ncbi:MAG: hypothetical protein JW990_11585 [Thermoleophilia bacterium]|nr:hypothetical protein [Thermoleophilia bacterium]